MSLAEQTEIRSQEMAEPLTMSSPPWETFVHDGQIDVSYTFQQLPLKSLFVDYHEDVLDGNGGHGAKVLAYQRKQDKIAHRILKEGVKPDLFGTLIVNTRPEGVYAIVDGGTRYRALNGLGVPPETLVPCLVFDWDEDREIRNYVNLNRERSGLSQVDVFVAEVKYGDPVASRIQEILVRVTGHGVGYGSDAWQCVAALKNADNLNYLENELTLMDQLGWLAMPGGRTQNTIGALTLLYRLPNFDRPTAIERWQGLTPRQLVNEAKLQKDAAGQSRGVARLIAMYLGHVYNKGMRGPKKLDLVRLAPRVADDDTDE